MKKSLIKTLFVLWTIFFLIGISKNFSNYRLADWIVISLVFVLPCIILGVLYKKVLAVPNATQNEVTNVETTGNTVSTPVSNSVATENADVITSTYMEVGNVTYRTDGKPISDEEIPYLMEIDTQKAIEYYKSSPNPKFHRTEYEEDLSYRFELNHDSEISKHTDSFESLSRKAFAEEDLDKKIELLQLTISTFEKEKEWFYRTKGGSIYFQDYYEHMHSSQNPDFSYIDSVKNYLDECIKERDYIIPKILDIISSQNGILQKDIYQHLPDISKTDLQRIIRRLESSQDIVRSKRGSSYLLTLKIN